MGTKTINCEVCNERKEKDKKLKAGLEWGQGVCALTAGMAGFVMSTVTLVTGATLSPGWLSSSVLYTAVLAIFFELMLVVWGSAELTKCRK
jgi:hypothetical protein